jgi:hypothetical protein
VTAAPGGARTEPGAADGDDWFTVQQTEALVGESASTIRRRITSGSLRHRTRRVKGREIIELSPQDVWAWRRRQLDRLRVTVDPLAPHDESGVDPTLGDLPSVLTRLAGVEAALGQARSARDEAETELRRVKAALEIMFAADDAQDDRVRAAEGQIEAAEERVRVAEERADLLKGAARSLLR